MASLSSSLSSRTSASRGAASTLYRSILRAHKRYLPKEMKELGDTYVRSEFRLHKTAKPELAKQFFREWEAYLGQILQTARARESASIGSFDGPPTTTTRATETMQNKKPELFQFGSNLPHDVNLSEDRVAQLQKLKEECEKAATPK